MSHTAIHPPYTIRQRVGLFLGPSLFLLFFFSQPPEGLSLFAWHTAGVGSLIIVWWLTEAIPLPVTGMLPIVLLPTLGIANIGSVTSAYTHPIIFLFLGGFIIARAMQQSGLHERIALNVIRLTGTGPRAIIIGFMLAAAFLSMWISNTATAVMMMPIGVSIVQIVAKKVPDTKEFGVILMLSIAYASSVGGMGTIIGTPPNAFFVAFMEENYDIYIGFAQWLVLGIPIVIIGLFLVYFVLTKLAFKLTLKELPGGETIIKEALEQLGKIKLAEKWVLLVFSLTVIAWVIRPFINQWIPGLSDTGIVITAAVILFLLPVNWKKGEFVLHWQEAEKLPWGVLILFGGGIALSVAINDSGLASWIGDSFMALNYWPVWLLILLVIASVVILTEFTSNLATTAAFLPIVSALALAIGQPILLFAIPMTLAASCAFMMPVATPANAIVYSSKLMKLNDMLRAGIFLNIIFTAFIFLLTYTIIYWWFT